MNDVVFDASAMLALLHHERGQERLTPRIIECSIVSAVNLAEVQSKLVKNGGDPNVAWRDALSVVNAVESFTQEHAKICGDLITTTQKYGLSMGDRCCLALAISLKAPVYTAEQIWRNLSVGVPIHVIR